MKRQVLVIHGGGCFEKYKYYLADLKKTEVSLKRFKGKRWKNRLQKDLGSSFEVISPEMPNGFDAKYLEWKIWLEKFIPFLRHDVILLGHSLGGIFLAKYLSENKFPKKIKATLLVAAPYFDKPAKDIPRKWLLPKSLSRLEKQGGKIFLYQSKDDKMVPFADVKKYEKALPSAHVRIFSNKGHFILEKFPEIVREIKNI